MGTPRLYTVRAMFGFLDNGNVIQVKEDVMRKIYESIENAVKAGHQHLCRRLKGRYSNVIVLDLNSHAEIDGIAAEADVILGPHLLNNMNLRYSISEQYCPRHTRFPSPRNFHFAHFQNNDISPHLPPVS